MYEAVLRDEVLVAGKAACVSTEGHDAPPAFLRRMKGSALWPASMCTMGPDVVTPDGRHAAHLQLSLLRIPDDPNTLLSVADSWGSSATRGQIFRIENRNGAWQVVERMKAFSSCG